jgi:serine phosphatase RsbU (regulator of sigma subunit)
MAAGPGGSRLGRRLRVSGRAGQAVRVLVLVVLLAAEWALVAVASTPALAVAMYGLVPVVLGGYWFGLRGALGTATAATLVFLTERLLYPAPDLAGATLWLATLNRGLVFFGVGILVTLLLRRERALALRLRAQEEQLAELESLRAALTPAEVPHRPHLRVATSFTPAEGLLAGDFFLVAEGPGDSTTIVVGDVVGHGLDAARCAAFVRSTCATFARFTSDPVQLLQMANGALSEHGAPEAQFVTVVCLNITPPPEQLVRWAAAGHEVPWDLDSAAPLPGGRVSAPLGIAAEPLTIEAGTTTLIGEEGLLVFTDGLVEGRAARRAPSRPLELFGEERVRTIVRAHRGRSPAEVLDALVSAVTAFAGGAPADDLCMVAIRCVPSETGAAVGHTALRGA